MSEYGRCARSGCDHTAWCHGDQSGHPTPADPCHAAVDNTDHGGGPGDECPCEGYTPAVTESPAPDAVEIAADVLAAELGAGRDHRAARAVVAALSAAGLLVDRERLAALEAVAKTARGLLILNAPGRAWDEQMRAALDAVSADETASGEA